MPLIINFWVIGASMLLSVPLGFIWYGPLFGKKWMQLSGIVMPDQKPSLKMMLKPIILSFIGAFFMSYVLSVSIAFHDAFYFTTGFSSALSVAFLLWLGFIVPVYLNLSGWEGKPWVLFFINSGFWLVFLMIIATMIVVFG